VVHEVTQRVQVGAGVRVALGVGVPEGVGEHAAAVEGQRLSVFVGGVGDEFGQAVDPAAEHPGQGVCVDARVVAVLRRGEQEGPRVSRDLQCLPYGEPFLYGERGLPADLQPAPVPAGLAVVPDQDVLAGVGVQAVDAQPAHFPGAAAGVAQQDVDGAEHGLHRFEWEVSVGSVSADQMRVGVELGDDQFGDGLAGLVLGGVLVGDRVVLLAGERGGEMVKQL